MCCMPAAASSPAPTSRGRCTCIRNWPPFCGFAITPYEPLRAAPAVPADFLQLDAGVIAPGKLADIVLVEGNPLENIADTTKVRRVIANGRMFTIEDLVSGKAKNAPH